MPKGRKVDPDQVTLLNQQGKTNQEIADLMGVNKHTISEWNKRLKLKANRQQKPLSARAKRMLQESISRSRQKGESEKRYAQRLKHEDKQRQRLQTQQQTLRSQSKIAQRILGDPNASN